MDRDRLKSSLPQSVRRLVKKSVHSVLGGVGLLVVHQSDAVAALHEDPTTPSDAEVNARVEAALPETQGALLLDLVRKDPVTGEQIVGHYSHASHASHYSHQSHYSHYSSRP